MRIRSPTAAALAGFLISLGGCGGEPPLQVVSTLDPALSGPLIAAFASDRGRTVKVEQLEDREGVLASRLAEGAEGIDLLWVASAASLRGVDLGRAGGVLSGGARAVELPGPPRVLAFAAERVAPHETPRSWMDLTRDWWRGRLAIADPQWLAARGHLGAMNAYWERRVMPGFFGAVAEGLAENQVALLAGGDREVLAAILSGRADAGPVDLDLALAVGGVAVAMLRHDPDPRAPESGPWRTARAAVVLPGPNAAAAADLAEFMAAAAAAEAERWREFEGDLAPLRDEGAAAAEAAAVAALRTAIAKRRR